MKENPEAKAAILKGVKEQLKSPESPYVKTNYDRLLNEGIEEEEVMNMLGSILAIEMWEISKYGRVFDEETYIQRLEKLPDMSWMDEE